MQNSQENKRKCGRPRKYKEATKTVCFMLPKSAIANLNQLAKEKGCSRTQYLVEIFEDMFK